ncbi:hypothetical protein KY285_016089 [Solanum tuberosum]|nr:hypothetical protein KY284_016100 [Solanum tuberosum]KAH0701811.1 hypothetical protein KY285_016089 [Solanum tuberosum]
MSSIASDPCDYDIGDYDCDDEGYACEDNGDYGGYDNSHDQEPNGNKSYYSGGEYEENGEHSFYGEDGEEASCGSSYGDEGACERSYSHSESEDGSYDDAGTCYTSHSQDEGKVRYNTLLYKKYEEHAPKACEDSHSYSCANPDPSRSSVYGYTSSSQSHPRGRRDCATLKSKDTISYTSHDNAHLLGYGNQGRYDGCVKGLRTKMIDFLIFEGRRDPEAYLDWEWQCEKTFQTHDLRGQELPLYALFHLKGLALGWWTQEGRLRTLQGNTHPLTWEELKRLMRFRYVPKGYTKLFNVDLRRLVLRTKVGICGALGLDLVLDDEYNLNYITPDVVAYLGLPRLHKTYPYTMEGGKVTKGVKVSFTRGKYYEEVWCDIMHMASCHLSLGANWFNEHRVPNEQNGYKCVVDHWGTPLFPLPKVKNERQKIERSTGKQGGNLRVEKREVERSDVRGLPQSQSNSVVHPSLGKDSYV